MQRILMVGKPNCGKSLLFNQLTGLRQKVANYPGITVEITRGKCDQFELVDLPGAYSLNGLTRDEVIAVEEIKRSVADDDTSNSNERLALDCGSTALNCVRDCE